MKRPAEQIIITYVVSYLDDWTLMSAHWDKNMHPVGVYVKYNDQISHKYAYSVLCEGVWKALQDPEGFNVSSELFEDQEGRNPPPYAVLTREP